MKQRTVFNVGLGGLFGLSLAVAIMASAGPPSQKGYSRDIPPDAKPQNDLPALLRPAQTKSSREAARILRADLSDAANMAIAEADAAELEYRNAIDTNKKQPGSIPEAEVERLHRVHSDRLLGATSKQVKFLQAEVNYLGDEVLDLRTVKVRPVKN